MDSLPNILDVAIVALLTFFVVKGFVQGLVKEVMGLVGIIAALFLSVAFYKPVADMARSSLHLTAQWVDAAAFAAILLIVFGLSVWLGVMISKLLMKVKLSPINRLLGGALGLAKGVLLAYVLLNLLLLLMPFKPPVQLQSSYVASYVIQSGSMIISLVPDDLIRDLQQRSGWAKQEEPAPAEKTTKEQ